MRASSLTLLTYIYHFSTRFLSSSDDQSSSLWFIGASSSKAGSEASNIAIVVSLRPHAILSQGLSIHLHRCRYQYGLW